MIAPNPFNQHLGFELLSRGDGEAALEMVVQPWFRQEGDVVHGGVITALADTTCVYAIGEAALTGVELKINFLRPARMDGGSLSAKARVVKRGNRLAVCAVDVLQGGEVAATGLFTFMIRT